MHFLVEAFFKPKENYLNVFTPNPDLPKGIGHIEMEDKKKYYNYDGIFDKDIMKLNQQ